MAPAPVPVPVGAEEIGTNVDPGGNTSTAASSSLESPPPLLGVRTRFEDSELGVTDFDPEPVVPANSEPVVVGVVTTEAELVEPALVVGLAAVTTIAGILPFVSGDELADETVEPLSPLSGGEVMAAAVTVDGIRTNRDGVRTPEPAVASGGGPETGIPDFGVTVALPGALPVPPPLPPAAFCFCAVIMRCASRDSACANTFALT